MEEIKKTIDLSVHSPLIRIPKKFLDRLTNSDKRVRKVKVIMITIDNELKIKKLN